MTRTDAAVIGAGPGGLAAALAAEKAGAQVVLIERETRLGGILKQCIHDGFGLHRFAEKLTGPEYAWRFERELPGKNIAIRRLTFVSKIEQVDGAFRLTLVSAGGMETLEARALVLATGCRERTARQVAIHGWRPAGVLTAGAAQYYVNILGQMPTRRCVILGSGDIGLIMARRLTLEGAEVLGVYEAKSAPSGLSRNIAQCLHDFGIPLHLSRTVTRTFGRGRLEGVEVAVTDRNLHPVPGTEERIPCDGLILSVGLIPENELAESLSVPLDSATKGPVSDQNCQTAVPGVFCCGNALQVNDLADFVSESGETAGAAAADYAAGDLRGPRRYVNLSPDAGFLSVCPQRLDLASLGASAVVFFRSRQECGPSLVQARCGGRVVFSKKYERLRPPEMERIVLENAGFEEGAKIEFTLEPL
jgi:thioredoxin reductase